MLDSYQNKCYKNTSLKQVIFRIDFPEPVPNEKILINGIDDIVKEYFPITEKDTVKFYNKLSFEANAETGNVQGATNRFEGVERTFCDSTKRNKVTFSNDSIVFTYNRYESFDKMFESIEDILNNLLRNNKILAVRTGLRYVNLYNSSPIDFKTTKNMFSNKLSKIMVPSLIKTLKNLEPIRSILTTEYVYNDIKVIYRAGQYNQFYPTPIIKDDFALDIDCFTNNSMDSAEDFCGFISKAHFFIQFLFEQSIGDKMREVMNNAKW